MTAESRRLATILALDVVGYSRSAARDDSAAAATVRKVRAMLDRHAGDAGGRVFSSAGDGFMLEFPTTSTGVQAARSVLQTCKAEGVQVRMGLHLGEVIAEPSGDLLGHGVNIAARLQQMAKPGQILISEDAHRSARSAIGASVLPMGAVKLDKMDEMIEVFELDPEGPSRFRFRLDRRLVVAGAAVLAVATMVFVGVIIISRPSAVARTAVFAFASDDRMQNLAESIASEIIETMNQIGLEPISLSETAAVASGTRIDRAANLGAQFAFDGAISTVDDLVRVSVRLEDVRGRRSLWSRSFERPAAEAGQLRLETASVVVKVLRCATQARRELPNLSQRAMSTLLRGCELEATSDRPSDALALARQFAESHPRSSMAQGRLAYVLYWNFLLAPAAMQPQLRQEALAAADAALRIDPRNDRAATTQLLVLAESQPHIEHERLIESYLQRTPNGPELNKYYAYFLRDVGRNEEAVAYLQRAVAGDPLNPDGVAMLAWILATVGEVQQARQLLSRTNARWPDNTDIWWNRFRVALWYGDYSEAMQVLDEATPPLSSAEAGCYRAAIAAVHVGRRRAEDVATLRSCLQPSHSVAVFAAAGEVDAAFDEAEEMLTAGPRASHWSPFFMPAGETLRRDPRFWPIMHRAGLAEYWLEMDRWPDFCREPDLPHDCREAARRFSAQAD